MAEGLTAAEIVIRMRADLSDLEKKMRDGERIVGQSTKGMKSSISSLVQQARDLLPALTVAGFAAFGKSAFTAADHINDLALRTGILGSTLSALNIPLLKGGSNVDELAASINRMNNMVGEAAKGLNQEAIRAFDDLGLSVEHLKRLSPEDQFFEIVSALSQMDSQSKMTNAGMAIFGRSFATMIPLIKDSKGNLREFTDELKRNGDSLSDEELARIDEFGDRWTETVERLKKSMLEAVPALKLYLDGLIGILNLPANSVDFGRQIAKDLGIAGNPNVSGNRPQTADGVTQDPAAIDAALKARGLPGLNSARGSNRGLLKDPVADKAKQAQKALDDYNTELKRQHEYSMLAPRDAEAMKVYYDTLELAQKAGVQTAEELAYANAEVARSNYDIAKAQEEAIRFSQEMKDKFSDALTSIITDFDSASEAGANFLKVIAEMILQKKIAGPLADSLLGTSSGGSGLLDSAFSGLGDFFGGFFAEGGRPPVGKASIVGEKGPELFIPPSQGTIIPNHALGGSQVVLHQTIVYNDGVQEAARQQVAASLPMVRQSAIDGVFEAIQRGGSASKLVGKR